MVTFQRRNHCEILRDGRLNITKATSDFSGKYDCIIKYNEEIRDRDGTVCLDVLAEGKTNFLCCVLMVNLQIFELDFQQVKC